MAGHSTGQQVLAHPDSRVRLAPGRSVSRLEREDDERQRLTPGATLAAGAGQRARLEQPDPERTCFERDRDRIIHSTAFRRLAGKTQVVVYPTDHQRTRLTHALEVAQVAGALARGLGLNQALTEAIALGHDCGHGPGGHASEDAFNPYIEGGYDHGPWGADVVLVDLNLCQETLDGIRNHSWSRPAPTTPEGEVVSWADRIAYCAHDLEDAIRAGIVSQADIPVAVAAVCGRQRRDQIRTFIQSLVTTTAANGRIGLDPAAAQALAGLRAFNYERIYTRPESVAQADAVIALLRGLVEYYVAQPADLPPDWRPAEVEAGNVATVRAAVTYVGGMTDRFAFEQAERFLGWDRSRLPPGMGRLA
ncbi:MAG: HD domain-containing protein [Propionibacteriaceae bacterium]|jgi:dGTPase|nr:HD domain-containing protein [Propionibacteriaceae bacterium]